MRYDLQPTPYRLSWICEQVMRLSDDLRRCVAFIGILDGTVPSGIRCFGTGFFVAYKGFRYFVTNQHIVAGIGHSPFAIRLNRTDGTSINVSIDLTEDNLKWICNTNDPDVDLAIMPMNYDFSAGSCNVLYARSYDAVNTIANDRGRH